MSKITYRATDDIIEHIDELVNKDEIFESQSDFNRFAAQHMIELTTGYEPSNEDYHEKKAELDLKGDLDYFDSMASIDSILDSDASDDRKLEATEEVVDAAFRKDLYGTRYGKLREEF